MLSEIADYHLHGGGGHIRTGVSNGNEPSVEDNEIRRHDDQ